MNGEDRAVFRGWREDCRGVFVYSAFPLARRWETVYTIGEKERDYETDSDYKYGRDIFLRKE